MPEASAARADRDQATQPARHIGDVFGGPAGSVGGRLIRVKLTDSPISRAGYWFGTAVGAAWGFLLSTGRIETRRGMIVFRGMPKWAFGRGGACVGGTYLTDRNVNDRVLTHEAVHREQWRKYGMLFPLLYLIAGRDPLRNRFEIEAGLEDGGYLPRGRPSR